MAPTPAPVLPDVGTTDKWFALIRRYFVYVVSVVAIGAAAYFFLKYEASMEARLKEKEEDKVFWRDATKSSNAALMQYFQNDIMERKFKEQSVKQHNENSN